MKTETLTVAADTTQMQLIGTWRITAVEDRKDYDPNGEWMYPYGRNPKGHFVYDSTGHVMVQIVKTPQSPPFASGDDEKPTAEGSLKPSFIDTDQPRPFILTGDHLMIGDGKTWRRVLERVK